ncbi:hypothetical protein [Acidithiobacillus sulfurivorans]|uniref:Transglycosylase SLT domain-containing protein n=1 Tax=Acidithiobacillus sulfurivorans TaxID=1958756 RepID=A0ABS6A1V4_9PROT|nr:hypothetical protein [Acidithiobacillus sulfurivorans]MBU2761101.1 hypothetical protein [Acidithiobacillus sulfurivorans]
MSDLSNLLSFLDPQQILQVGKALNTGQVQQMTATEQLLNQKLQEQSLFQEEMAGATAKQNYLTQTDSISQLPGQCEQSQAAAGLFQSAQSANVQGAMANVALGDDGGPGVINGKANMPTQQEKIQSLAALSGPGGTGQNQTDAHALFEGKDSGNALVVESTLLDPIPSQPITAAQAATPAGVAWQSQHNAAEAGLSLAASSMGLVAGLHAISVPGSAVSAVSAVVGAAPKASTSATMNNKPSPALSAVATRAPAQSPSPASNAGNWQQLVPHYVNQVAAAAQYANISPAIIAATIAHEDSTGDLKAMPCTDPQSYPFGGGSSLICLQADSTAKSLGQMIDPTAISLGANYGLTNPMVVYGQHPNIELKAMATGLKYFLGQCNGNVACTFGAWNYGHVAPGMSHGVWPNAATAQYAATSMGFYTGAKQVNVGTYQGSGAGASDSGGNENAASTAGLLRLVSLGSYANPAFYNQLAATTPAGAWRTLVFLKAMSLRVSNQNRRLMERLSAIMATRVALAEQQNLHAENPRRGNAMAQSNGAIP